LDHEMEEAQMLELPKTKVSQLVPSVLRLAELTATGL